MCIGIYNMIVGCIHVDVCAYLYLCVHVLLCPAIAMQRHAGVYYEAAEPFKV